MTSLRSLSIDLDLDLERDGADGAERVTLWRDAMGLAGKVHLSNTDAFTGTFVSRSIGDLLTMRISSRTFRFERGEEMAKHIQPDYVIVNLVERGRLAGTLAGRKIVAEPGTLLLSGPDGPMDLLMEDATWLALILARNLFEKHLRWSPSLHARVFAPQTVQAVILGGLVRSLIDLPDPLPAREVTRATHSSLALLVACLGGPAPPPPLPDHVEDDPARSIRRFIAGRLSDPDLGPDLICREFDISRSRLYRIMGERGRIAMIVRRLRLRAAHREIASGRFSNLPLAAIGRRHGLRDERNFRRAFVQEFGYPPSALRQQAPEHTGQGMAALGAIGADLEHWFLGLSS